jgi:hypothetical protein
MMHSILTHIAKQYYQHMTTREEHVSTPRLPEKNMFQHLLPLFSTNLTKKHKVPAE